MDRRLAFLGGIAVAVAALWRMIRRRPPGWVEPEAVDPRAQELRRRLGLHPAGRAPPDDPPKRPDGHGDSSQEREAAVHGGDATLAPLPAPLPRSVAV